MPDTSPLVDQEYLLQKYPGKGGWTYALIPEVAQDKNNPFGWVKVRGSIDSYELKHYKLMPAGNERLFLPVKAAIRKAIGKQAGDQVRVVLYRDDTPLTVPEEITFCFETEPAESYQKFTRLPEGERKALIDWIYEARTDETKVERIARMMKELTEKRFFDR